MSRTILVLALLVVSAALPARAEIGTIDNVPAATLLLPCFEVDLDDPLWHTTLFSINNSRPEPAIAHVTLWTDLSIPTLDFNVYLTGYDVVTFNLADLFGSGRLPATSHDDPAVSNVGDFSLVTSPVTGVGPGSTSCDTQLPLPNLPPSLLAHIRAAHTGKASAQFGGQCSGVNHGDNLARGYITIDNVNFCTLDFPGDTGYFIAGGQGAANNENQLWGDYFFVSGTHNTAEGETLVHLEASDALGAANYTFYRRYSGGADQREGLGSTFAVRFATEGAFNSGSTLAVWRDSKRAQSPFACGTLPPPFPLVHTQIVEFDEQENPAVDDPPPFSPPPAPDTFVPFPWEVNKVKPNSDNFPVGTSFGWFYLNLNVTVIGSQVPFGSLAQNWVSVNFTAGDRFSVGFDAINLDNVTDPAGAPSIELPVCDGAPDPAGCS